MLYKKQIRVPESGHMTVKYLTETVEIKKLLKLSCPIFFFQIIVLINKYD